MKETKIGDEIHIKCVEAVPRDKFGCVSCVGCALWLFGCNETRNCSNEFRTDKKNVHFEIIND